MKVLIVNKFLYPKGGDAVSALNTGNLLSLKGHEVVFWGMKHPLNPEYPYGDYFVPHVDLNNPGGLIRKLSAAVNCLYSFDAVQRLEQLVRVNRPDIAHLHNFVHQISPSILHVFKKHRIPVVMTLHDYKLVCASYYMLSKGRICERCKGQRYYNCFIQGCSRGSRIKSLLNTVEMYLHQKILRIYDLADVFIAPSMFLKVKFTEMGFKGKVVHLPYYSNLEEFIPRYDWEEDSIVYFGRLAPEKGLFTLLQAMKGISGVKLKVIGEGPLREALGCRANAEGMKNVEFKGYMSGEALKDEIRQAIFVVLPSEWYENYPFTVLESFALGKPVLGARIGGIPELVEDGITGFTFKPADSVDLAEKIRKMLGDRSLIYEMGQQARKRIEAENVPDVCCSNLMEIYQRAIQGNL